MQNTNSQNQMNRDSGVGVDRAGGTTSYSRDYLSNRGSDENMKENIDYTDDEVQAWLDSLSPKVNGKKRT